MRIALFHNLPTGGGKRHLFEQARELARRGHELELFAPRSAASGEGAEEYLPLDSFCRETHLYGGGANVAASEGDKAPSNKQRLLEKAKTQPIARELLDFLWAHRMQRTMRDLGRLYHKIADDIESRSFDVVYVHHCVLTLAPELLRFLHKTPTVFCCNDTQRSAMEWPVETDPEYDADPATWLRQKRRGRILGRAQRRFVETLEARFITNTRAATMVLANSYYSREALVSGAGVNAQVCYPGVDTDFFCPLDGIREREKKILSVGALLPTKRHDFVLESVALLPPSIRPRLEIIGYSGGPQSAALENRLQERAREMGVDLTIRKHVKDTELREAYRCASLVAFTPYLEPFGLAAVEGMACGTPVVGVREAGVRETVTHEETGLLTGLDRNEFAISLKRLLTDMALVERLGQRARQDAVERWTWRRSTDALEPLLGNAAKCRSGL